MFSKCDKEMEAGGVPCDCPIPTGTFTVPTQTVTVTSQQISEIPVPNFIVNVSKQFVPSVENFKTVHNIVCLFGGRGKGGVKFVNLKCMLYSAFLKQNFTKFSGNIFALIYTALYQNWRTEEYHSTEIF